MRNSGSLPRAMLMRLMLGVVTWALATAAQAQATIDAVTGAVQGGAEMVRIELSQALSSAPNGFVIQSPARIALDFPGFANAMGRSALEINQGNLRSVSVVQAGDRSRVVLNLKQSTTYKTQIQGKTLLVLLDPVAASPVATAAVPTVFAESRSAEVLALKDIDFRRGNENAGRVVVSLANSQVGVDIRQQGQNLIVEFLKTTLPDGLRRRLDVADFGTPVQKVSSFQSGDRVRMVIEPTGQWEHSAYQSDDQFVVEVRPVKTDSTKLSQGPGFSGEKLSLNFQSIEVRSLLQVIADFTNFNIITSDSVSGNVTLRLKDVPWDQALDIILQAKGLGMRKNNNVLWIAPKEEIAAKDKLEFESRNAIQTLEPLRTQEFQLNYLKATELVPQLMGMGTAGAPGAVAGAGAGSNASRILSPRGGAVAIARTNQVIITDIASKLQQIQQLLTRIDVPVRQVLIEARIVEASDTFGKSLGVRLGGTDRVGTQLGGTSTRGMIGSSYSNVVASSGQGGAVDTTSNFVNLPAIGQNGSNPATFAISIFNSAVNRVLNLEISALEADGKGKIVSSPRVVTADQIKAIVEQGTELPYQQATSSGATSVAFRKANLKLEVTPQITPEGNIILDLDVNKDSVGVATAAGYAIDTKHITTKVLVENGGTVVIGGIFTLDETENETRVPLLGDLPAIGNLFKSRARTSVKKEMLVFITPKMITDRTSVR